MGGVQVCLLFQLSILWLGSASLPQCVQDRANNLPGNQFLQTSNTAQYLCTIQQLQDAYDPKNISCGQTQEDSADVAGFVCPIPGTTILCALTIGWGSVAGVCSTCYDSCSTTQQSGENSCCGVACDTNNNNNIGEGDGCSTSWIPDEYTDQCGTNSTDGYCDCCPTCGDCVKSSIMEQDGLSSTFCDCRSGLDASPDWAPCWDSCMDCFGDGNPNADGQPASVAYPTESFVTDNCIGSSACYIGTFLNKDEDGNLESGTWAACSSEDDTSCVNATTVTLSGAPKFKALMLCA